MWGMLKSHRLGLVMQVTKGGSFHREGRFSLCKYVILLYCETLLQDLLGTVKDFIGYLFSLYYCCFTCLRLVKPKVQLKVP